MYKTELFNELATVECDSKSTPLTEYVIQGVVQSEAAFLQLRFLLDSLISEHFMFAFKDSWVLLGAPRMRIALNRSSIKNGRISGFYNDKQANFSYEMFNNLMALYLYGECIGVFRV